MPRRRAFSLMELLVVLSIIAVVSAMLMPALGLARETSKSSTCSAHMHSIGMGVTQYTSAFNDQLPHMGVYAPPYDERWNKSLAPYSGLDDNAVIGKTGLRCPSFNPVGYAGGVNDLAYGVNFPGVMAWVGSPNVQPAPLTLSGGAKLTRVPADVFLIADIRNPADESSSAIYHPVVYAFDTDTDGDGVADSNSTLFAYNGFDPRHGNRSSGNFLFADGSARAVTLNDWLNNANGLWGVDDASYK